VSYADLNLASMKGQTTLNRRVDYAVDSVCAESTISVDYYDMHNCKNFAWSGAQPQIDRAIQRAREIASTGSSSIAAAAIVLTFPK
jgi:UrcA family protein